jgi:hypothetical protein
MDYSPERSVDMSTTPSTAHSRPASNGSRGGSTLCNILIDALFVLVSVAPKLMHLRRNTHSWMFFRIFLGIAGAALVVLPLGLSNGYIFSIVGLAMFAGGILLPPVKPERSTDHKARELGALVVVHGGRYQLTRDSSVAVQLFVGTERISVLDSRFNPLLVIPVNEITSARAEESAGHWILRIAWADQSSEFCYRGIFAERLVRVAESTVRSVMRPSLPIIPQARAARA